MNRVHATESSYYFLGPAGRLEAHISTQGSLEESELVGVICHPHPLYEGSMQNKVVTTIASAWQQIGLATVRFNFRGVGNSEGQYGEGIGEMDDLLAVLSEIQKRNPKATFWLGGFSFGSYIALAVAAKVFEAQASAATIPSHQKPLPIQALLSIAPPVRMFNFELPTLPDCPWFIHQGERDQLVSFEDVQQWFQGVSNQKPEAQFIPYPNADHFFHGQLVELKGAIIRTMAPLKAN